MGQRISDMTPDYFLKGGFGGQIESVELSINLNESDTTVSATTENIAALAAPFRSFINHSSTLSIEDDTDAIVTIAKIPMREIARELIRIGDINQYDPNDPDTFPTFNTFNAGTLRFNLLFKMFWNGGNTVINYTTVACDAVGSPDNWIISGLSGSGEVITGESLPRPYPADQYNLALWPSSIYMDFDGAEQYIIIEARVNLAELDELRVDTLGTIDGVFLLQNLF